MDQEFAIAFDQRGDRLTNPRRVQGAQKRPVVTLKFYVPPDHKDLLVLIVRSLYPRIVRYRAAARARGYRDFYETNMLPLNPNVPAYEGWSDPFVELSYSTSTSGTRKFPKWPNQAMQRTAR